MVSHRFPENLEIQKEMLKLIFLYTKHGILSLKIIESAHLHHQIRASINDIVLILKVSSRVDNSEHLYNLLNSV